jgi:hypothetical protein
LKISDTISSTGTRYVTTAWRATKKLHLLLYKIRQIQAIKKAIMRDELIFVIGFCTQYMTVLLTWEILFTDETWFHLSGYINAQNNMYLSDINLRQTSESAPSWSEDWCEMCHCCSKNSITHIYWRDN